MTDPTHDDHPPGRPWRLDLDNGETLQVDSLPADSPVSLRMTAMRALDLSRVLRTYSRMVDLVTAAEEVSGTEDGLARALHDAGTVARGPAGSAPPAAPGRVTSASRLSAMAALQQHRPRLTHTELIGVVDAAARWLDEAEYDLALGLLQAVGGDETGMAAWQVLLAQSDRGAEPGTGD